MLTRALDATGQVLAATPNAAAPSVDPRVVLAGPDIPPYDAVARLAPPTIARPPAGAGAFGLTTDAEGRRWRLYVLPVHDATQYLLGAVPLDRIDASIAGFRRLMALLALASTVLSLLIAWLLARRALRPVATLTTSARRIARSRSLAERVPVGDRDELGQLATTFNGMLVSLEEAHQAQQRFVADASHELRAPLTAIQANLQLLQRQPEMPPAEQREALDEASREAHRLAKLVADLLALARADAGMSLRRRTVELDRVLLDSVSEARHLSRGQRIEIGGLEPALVEGDPDYLRQLLLILLDNALKYTPPEGTVTLGLWRRGPAVELTVQDTGVGIPAADLPHVFERFYRADPARARDPGGMGLGLSIARWIAQQHGGDIMLASQQGVGTIVTIRLPIRD
jgi:two-component system, OmpR family, sensor kinase